jgi:predicted amidohydrolase
MGNNKIVKLFIFAFFLFNFPSLTGELGVKVAVVHFQPVYKDTETNIASLLHLADEAGSNGAKIVVFPELATTGYSFFSRDEISKVSEAVPGRLTELFSEITTRYEMYIVLGFPEYEPDTNLFYNSAVLIGPNGIEGIYRKHSHLMEASWSASGTGKVPVFETCYGKLAILICADINYSELTVQAGLEEAQFLILPTNGGINTNLLRARALEGNCHIILSNRFGDEKNEYSSFIRSESFNEETFTLLPPFYYDFQGSQSCIIDSRGELRVLLENPNNCIGFCILPLNEKNMRKVVRRPKLYSLLQHNTLDPFPFRCMNLPKAGSFYFALQISNLILLKVGLQI